MTFDLSEELIDSIISAMENQEMFFVVEAASGSLITIPDSKEGVVIPDDENFYSLPEWNSADGYALREDFVNSLHTPLAHDELQAVLHSGRGVFKSFRNVLKSYPDVDKRWHIFKHKCMSIRINEWYNSLREIWGLEKLEQLPESEESLIYDDFSFQEYDPAVFGSIVLNNISADFYGDENDMPEEVMRAIFEMWQNQFYKFDAAGQFGYVCQSYSEDFAGVITVSPITEKRKQTVVITSLFVSEQFRGLGICSELLSKCISELQSNGVKWIIIPNIFAPDIIQPLLTRTGFTKISSGYLLNLQGV